MFQACSVLSDSQFVCYTPSLGETTSSSGRDVSSECGPEMKYHNLTNELTELTVRIRPCFTFSASYHLSYVSLICQL